jgi:hypothetical protein
MKLLALALISTLLFLWLRADKPTEQTHAEMVPLRTPGGLLETHGFTRTEIFRKDTGSFLGITSSEIMLNATFRYAIELRSKWNLYIDDTRHVAFLIAPAFSPQLPVSVDSRTVFEWTESGWGRFNKWEHLQALHRDISAQLEKLAMSPTYIELGRKQARITVEEFVTDWILKHRGWPNNCQPCVKVFFADEEEIPLPERTVMKDYLP